MGNIILKGMILTVLHVSFPSASTPVNPTPLQSPNSDRNATYSSCPLYAPITQPRLLHVSVTETDFRLKHPALQKGLPKENKLVSFLSLQFSGWIHLRVFSGVHQSSLPCPRWMDAPPIQHRPGAQVKTLKIQCLIPRIAIIIPSASSQVQCCVIMEALTPILASQDSTAVSSESTPFPRHALEPPPISEIEESSHWVKPGESSQMSSHSVLSSASISKELHQKKPHQEVVVSCHPVCSLVYVK